MRNTRCESYNCRAVLFTALTVGAGLVSLVPQRSFAHDFILNDGNSSVSILADSSPGMNGWTVDCIPQLWQQQFFFRVGNTCGESAISSLPLISSLQNSANSLTTLYRQSGQFSIEVSYTLLGGAIGSGASTLGEQIRIVNLSDSVLNFSFFQFADFDLGGAYENDTVQLGQNLVGLYNSAYQFNGASYFADEVVSPGANYAEVGLSPTILARLTDDNPTTLNGNAGPVTGDATWAFQWDAAIPVGGSFGISLTKSVYVPEPSVLVLVPVAVALLARARGRRRELNK